MKKNIAAAGMSLLLVFFGFLQTATAQDAGVSIIAEEATDKSGEEFWIQAQKLVNYAEENRDTLRSMITGSKPKVRIVSAFALYTQARQMEADNLDLEKNLKREALKALTDVVKKNKGEPRNLAAKAITTLTREDANYGDVDPYMTNLKNILSDTSDNRSKLEVARALFAISGFSIKAVSAVEDVMNSTDDRILKFDAAVALTNMDKYDKAKPILKEYSKLPSEKGDTARMLLNRISLAEDLERLQSGSGGGSYPLVDEVLSKINKFYVDEDKISRQELIQGAAEGMMNKLDRFSTFLDKEQFKSLQEDINREYGGIGAIVTMKDGYLTIERPIYDGPAYEAGIRTNDQIVEVEGKSTYQKTLSELVDKLKGKPGTEVNVKVMRRGWTDARKMTITRGKIDMDTVRHRMLPGKIGYISIVTFGDGTTEELESAVRDLKQNGVQSVIVDVRRNTGGYLSAAVGVCDVFLKKGEKVVSIKGKLRKREKFASKEQLYDGPLTVLVDDGSASASEIFSGTMQDHNRATIIGQRTYGKGSVQKLEKLKSLDNKAAIKITWAKYYLPSGREIHKPKENTPKSEEWGIKPDVSIEREQRDFWFAYASQKLLDTKAPLEYFKKHRDEHLDKFKNLAQFDGFEWKKYPDFEKFYNGLDTKLNKNYVRKLLRQEIRRKVADIRGQAFIYDLQDDLQLQRSVYELLKGRDESPEDYTQYKHFSDKFTEGNKKEDENSGDGN